VAVRASGSAQRPRGDHSSPSAAAPGSQQGPPAKRGFAGEAAYAGDRATCRHRAWVHSRQGTTRLKHWGRAGERQTQRPLRVAFQRESPRTEGDDGGISGMGRVNVEFGAAGFAPPRGEVPGAVGNCQSRRLL
jgi:hypothetical protein